MAADAAVSALGGCSRHTGHLWAVSIYCFDVSREERDDTKPYVWALFELGYHDYDRGANGAMYAAVEFSHSELSSTRDLFPPLSKKQVYDCAQAVEQTFRAMAMKPICENLGDILAPSVVNQHAIKMLAGRLLHGVRVKLNLPGFYEPADFSVSRTSGLLTSVMRIDCAPSKANTAPAFVGLNASVSFDADAIASAVSPRYNGDPRGLGLERLKAVVRGKLRPSASEIEWLWPENRQNTSTRTDTKTDQHVSTTRFFLTREAIVSGPSWKPGSRLSVASVLPVSAEMVMVSAERFSCMALFSSFLKLYRGFYLKPDAPCAAHVRRPIMLAQFPVTDNRNAHGHQEQSDNREPAPKVTAQRRTKQNFLFMPGFPCLACVSISTAAESHDRATAACRAASLTENLWPAYGIRALHMLNRRPVAASDALEAARRKCMLTTNLLRSLETYPAGTITCAAGAPMIFSDCRLARFDFSAFYPCLYAAYVGEQRGLVKILHERLQKRAGSADLKLALVTMFGGLRYVDADGYRFVIGAANIIAKAVEKTANRLGFGVAAYVKDGFWGAFGSSSRTTAEELRTECEKSANAALALLVSDQDSSRKPPVPLVLRMEGTYTDGLLINANKYWLFDSASGNSFICGVVGGHERSGLSKETTSAADDILKKIKASAKSIDDVEAITKNRIDEWVYAVFGHRGDTEFWAEQTPGGKDFLIPEEIRAKTVGKLEAADFCLGGELSYVFIPKSAPEARTSKDQGRGDAQRGRGGTCGWHSAPAAAFPCSLVEDVFCLKINYEAHLLPRLEGLLAWSRIYAWLQFRNQISIANDEDETDAQARETARIDYNYGDVSFLFA